MINKAIKVAHKGDWHKVADEFEDLRNLVCNSWQRQIVKYIIRRPRPNGGHVERFLVFKQRGDEMKFNTSTSHFFHPVPIRHGTLPRESHKDKEIVDYFPKFKETQPQQ